MGNNLNVDQILQWTMLACSALEGACWRWGRLSGLVKGLLAQVQGFLLHDV